MATAAPTLPAPRWKLRPPLSGPEILRGQAHLLRPQEKLTVSQWAQKNRGYDPETQPWQAEIMDALGDPQTSEVGLLGPSQQGKSEIGLAWAGWIVDSDPGDMLICQPDRQMTQNFVETRLEPMIDATPTVRLKLAPAANANNIFLKKFRGMFLASIWPVPAQFAQRPIRFGWLDDYDQMDDDIGAVGGEGGQGSAIGLLNGRLTSYEGRDTKFVSSSPADDSGGKTEAFVAGGTDERQQPTCPQCLERWEPDCLRDLQFDGKDGGAASPDQAAASAHVICRANGCILQPEDRRKLLASQLTLPNFGWVPANEQASKRRRTFRHDGLLGQTSWGELARQWREALLAWESRQDEGPLRTFVQTKAGKNYRSVLSGDKPVETDQLKARREVGLHLGIMPAGVKVWVIVADVQVNRVECMAFGWGDGLEGWIVDRFNVDVMADGLTTLAPFSHPEHAAALLPLFSRRYKLADGSGLSPPPLTVQLDVGGGGAKGEGATAFAKAFWDAARAISVHKSRITLTKGGNSLTGDLMPRAKFADQKRRGGALRSSAELWMPNVHRIKHMIDARLRREDPGPGYIHLPGGKVGNAILKLGQLESSTGRLSDEHIEEITAEQLRKGRWEKVRPRNETWDLLVAAYAAILRPPFAQSRTHMRWVPQDYRVPDQAAAQMVDEPAPAPVVVKPTRPKPQLPRRGKDSWIKAKRPGPWLNRR